MIEQIIRYSVHNKLLIGLMVVALIIGGLFSLQQLSIDAVPDVTNNQVQVVTVTNALAAQEVEQLITYPVEVAMANLPNIEEIRSISRFGLSVVTIVFSDAVSVLDARQLVKEQIGVAESEIPAGLGRPELMPITTGLGEIYQYVLEVEPGFEDRYSPMDLRTIQDWIVKRQLSGIPGIIEVSSFGGYLKQYEVALDPILLQSLSVTVTEVFDALARNNQNSGGSYIEKNTNAYYIRTEGVVTSQADIEQIVVRNGDNHPILIKDLGEVKWGSPKRFGAMTMDGKGEAVGGITLMLKGANSSAAIANVQERVELVKSSLPEGIHIYPYLDRSVLVGKAIHTVQTNLLEGGIIVILVLILLLGNWRAGLIVASVIPLALLFAIILMHYFGVSANLMSLGAIDFGIVVDGAVIVVEGVLHTLMAYHVGKRLTQSEMDDIVVDASAHLFRAAVFGVFIILVVFVPVMTLTGIEGKMFRPMAMTFSFAILGAMLLSLTYVPMLSSLILNKNISDKLTWADRIMNGLKKLYKPSLEWALRFPAIVLAGALALLVGAFLLFRTLGAVFIPTLEEGDLAMQMAIQPGSSLQESVRTTTKAEQVLLANFPEIKHVVSKIGTAEVPTDPMAIEDADIMIILKEKADWTSADTREELVEKMKEKLEVIIGASFEFTQPIQLRFNELMTGAKTDIAIKVFGENTDELARLANKAAMLVEDIPGAADVKVDQTEGLPQLMIHFDRRKMAQYGLAVEDLNTLIRAAYAGEVAGVVFENERKFDLVVRLADSYRQELDLNQLFVNLANGHRIPLGEVASVTYTEGPMQVSREDARRVIKVGVNVRNRDVASLVADIQQKLEAELLLPPGYAIRYGGEFENLQKAQQRLGVAVPAALFLILALLYFTFRKVKYALLIFSAVPLSAIGGVVALWLRDMPFSISAGVGFIALFGVAVLNGIVLISYFNRLRYEEERNDIFEVIMEGSLIRLRPVIMTATVAALGFLPMALSTSNGAEVQKPLATVVIGGLVTATLLTLLVLPVLYLLVNRGKRIDPAYRMPMTIALLIAASSLLPAQNTVSLDQCIQSGLVYHPDLQNAALQVQRAEWEIPAARKIAPTEFHLQVGQINTDAVDYQFSVMQPLGRAKVNRQGRALAQAELTLHNRSQEWQEHEQTMAIKEAWYTWLYQREVRQLLEGQLTAYDSLVRKVQRQVALGESGRLDAVLLENQQLAIQQALVQIQEAEQESRLLLQQRSFWSGGWEPNEEELPILSLGNLIDGQDGFQAQALQQVEVARQAWQHQQLQGQPVWSVGYFNQSIRPDYALQGVQLGLQIPFYQQDLKAREEQRLLDITIAENQYKGQQVQLVAAREQAVQRYQRLEQQLNQQGRQWLSQSQELRRLAEQQLQSGEIDYFRFFQSWQIAMDNERTYLDQVHQYNLAVLRLQYLSF